ncbi:hypothetical protein Dimus_017285 [Dionaea muscipula]
MDSYLGLCLCLDMEFTSQEKGIGMPNSFSFTYTAAAAAAPNQESSSSSAKQVNLTAAAERGVEQVLRHEEDAAAFNSSPVDHRHRHQHHHNNNLQFRLHLPPQDLIPNTAVTRRSNLRPNQQDAAASPSDAALATAVVDSVRYRECQRNHAAHLGGHVVDGCGEFMPGSGEEGTQESFKCAACDCHRNFHRKEIDGELPPPPPPLRGANCYITHQPQPSKAINPKHINMISTAHQSLVPPIIQYHHLPPPHPPIHHNHHHHHHGRRVVSSSSPAMAAAFGNDGAAPAESSSEDLNTFRGGNMEPQPPSSEAYGGGGGASKKRYRTKFSQEQKDQMLQFAKQLGWRIQKQDEVQVQNFCDEVGVKRQVFKVWMHNNKQAMKRNQS